MRKMRGTHGTTTVVAILACVAFTIEIHAQPNGVPVASPSAQQVRHTACFAQKSLTFTRRDGYDVVGLAEGVFVNRPGSPQLPSKTIRIALPPGMKATGVHVIRSESIRLSGDYAIRPAQKPSRFGDPTTTAEFMPRDDTIYGSDEAYPGLLAELERQSDLAGQSFAIVRVHPLQYSPASKQLTLHSSIEFAVDGRDGYVCGDRLPAGASERTRHGYRRMLNGMLANAETIELREAETAAARSRSVAPGVHDYVIITQGSWVDDFQPLADWKTRKGVPATIVTTDWIFNAGGYTGSESEKIRAFVQDAHETWGAMYFLLGGDADFVPTHEIFMPEVDPDENMPTDTFYADYDGDWTVELHVGRASVADEDDINVFVNKILTYERNPPLTDYAKTATFLGCDQVPDGAEGENCKMDIHTLYMPGDWTVRTEYDSEEGEHKDDFLDYLDLGNGLVNHIDHSTVTAFGVGAINHHDYIHAYQILIATNGDRQPILYSVSCDSCDFAHATCFAEAFVQNEGVGGIAYIGNTRSGYSDNGEDDGYSLRYDRYFFQSLFHHGHHTLGDCFTDHKNDAFEDDDYYRYIFMELTLLGDPELPMWTEDPTSLTVAHDDTLHAARQNEFVVQVSDVEGPVESADVCLWKEGDIYAIGQTNEFGVATFTTTPANAGTLHVTVTGQNYLPHESEAVVNECAFGDVDCDGDVDWGDFQDFASCLAGPDVAASPLCAEIHDGDDDLDVDLADFAFFQIAFTGS